MRKRIREFVESRSGNFAISAVFLAVPILISAGMAMDYTQAVAEKTKLMAAADAAAIGALSTQSVGVLAAIDTSKDGEITVGSEDARKLFLGQLSNYTAAQLSSLNIKVIKTGTHLKSYVDFTVNVPTSFSGLVGKNSIAVSGKATAVYDTGSYVDFYMLLDNTPSMGVGATYDDIAKMESNTTDHCAFACHDVKNANSYYNLAKNLGVEMRIDVVREATKKLTETAKDPSYHNQYRMAVYTFGDAAWDRKLTQISDLSSDMDAVKTAAGKIDLMSVPGQNYNNDQDTDFDGAFKQMNAMISKVGDGSSAKKAQPVIFFVSDGVTDSDKGASCTKPTKGNRCQEPIDYTHVCDVLKKRGVKIAVLYTTYLPLPNNSWYRRWIAPFQNQIADNMKSCASPGYYFEVSPSGGISEAMQALFKKVVSAPRLAS